MSTSYLCSACGSRTHRRNHCAASPCNRCGGNGHFEARCGVCGGAGHADDDCSNAKTDHVRCETCGKMGHFPRDCPTRTGGSDDQYSGWRGYDACHNCGEPGHAWRDCPTRIHY